MGNWSERQEGRKEVKEKDKVRWKKLAGFFFDLAKLTFGVLVLGGVVPIYNTLFFYFIEYYAI